jgi:hypothetical protein
MSYVVSFGPAGSSEERFPSFRSALRLYRLKRAYMLTLPKRTWFSVSMHNDELLDVDHDGLTDDEATRVYDDSVPRALLNDRPGAYHGLVCGHVVTEMVAQEDGLTKRRCAVCGHQWKELPL